MIELLSLGAAVCYGSADFFGGLTARRANTVATVFWSQFVGLVLLLIVLPFLPAASVSKSDWVWGFVAGVSGGDGGAVFFRALSAGAVGRLVPTPTGVAGVNSLLFPVVSGGRPRNLTL